jgi:P-type Ca2+ transporter type 2C
VPERPYAAPAEAVLRELQVDPANGLSAEEAGRRLKRYGPNELLIHPPTTAARILINQLKGPVV